MKKYIALIALILIIIIGYNYIYKDHRDIHKEQPKFTISSNNINAEFINNPVLSQEKYLNKTIEISGQVTEVNSNNITLDNKVFCLFTNQIIKTIKKGEKVKIKGRVIGYDDLLEQIKLDQCSIIN
ncbi:OB-fold protein [Ichthyenterobacterium magnum]|uniref:Putative nucleic acid binding protein n=1 Tax=Ichthyenterobacterium magnum TaxID=1230530 RepID=A0A420DLC3_9FLAO|nr:hypothetical protein [Ichthyenterobacterium magnum]RKE94995.1 putative nucleic acid binding protein [Ichthyenterobacterium magnum]